MGAALVIWPKEHSFVAEGLSLRPVVFIGLISYSLYLWHWPVLVLYRHYLNGAMPGPIATPGLIATSAVLAYLSWRWIESPFRRPNGSRHRNVIFGLTASGLVAVVGSFLPLSGGVPSRLSEQVSAMASLDVMWEWDGCHYGEAAPFTGTYCTFGVPWDTAQRKAVLWGDSHAEHFAPILEDVGVSEGISFILLDVCPAAFGGQVFREWREEPQYKQTCENRRKQVFSAAKLDPKLTTFVLASSWWAAAGVATSKTLKGTGQELLTDGLLEVVSTLPSDAEIIVLDQLPTFFGGTDPASCGASVASGLLRRPCGDLGAAAFEASMVYQGAAFPGLDAIAAQFSNVTVVHPRSHLCEQSSCLTEVRGEFLYRDQSHYRRNLSPATYRKIAETIGLYGAFSQN